MVIPKGFFPQQDTGLIIGVTEAAPDVSFARMSTLQQQAVGRGPEGSGRRSPSPRSSAPTGPTPPPTAGGSRSRSSRATSGMRTPHEIIARLQPKLGQVRRHRRVPAGGPGPPDRRRGRAARSTSTRWRTRTRPSSPPGRRSSLAKLRTLPELRNVATDQLGEGPVTLAQHRPRHRLAARHLHPGHRRHALRRVRPAPGLDDLHPAQPVPGHPRGESGSGDGPELPRPDLRPQRLG